LRDCLGMRRQAIDGRAYHIKPTGRAELKKGPQEKRAKKRSGFVPKPVDKPYHALTPQKTKVWKIQALCHSLSLLVFAVFASKLQRETPVSVKPRVSVSESPFVAASARLVRPFKQARPLRFPTIPHL